MPERGVMYFGLDESNHAGLDKKGEIVVCTYSSNQEDSIIQDWPNRRENSEIEKWLSQEDCGFNFTLLLGERYKHQCSAINLTEAAPNLILHILTDPLSSSTPEKIKIYFDGGGFNREQKNLLRNYFKEIGLTDVVIDNFVKKNKTNREFRKGPRCPKLVYLADIIANQLYHSPAGELLSHKHLLP